MSKKVKEIFQDYKTKSNILDAYVNNLNLLKKTNTLEVELSIDEYIEFKDLYNFEEFLKERFAFENVDIVIKYHKETEMKSLEKEWKDIVIYISNKYPLMKSILMSNSEIETDNNIIKLKINIKGADFIKSKKIDVVIVNLIEKIYGKRYKIEIIENIKEDGLQKHRKKLEEIEKKEIETNTYYIENQNKEESIDSEVEEIEGKEDLEQNKENISKYIMGKPSRAKEKLMQINDIGANDGKIALQGIVQSCQNRETKTGKGMIIIELYDGTGTITCKSFAKDVTEGNEILEKINNAPGIKVIGKAGLDTFIGDISVIGNTIIEVSENLPEPPKEDEIEDTPIIVGRNINTDEKIIKMSEISLDSGNICAIGEIFGEIEEKELRTGKVLVSFNMFDGSTSMTCKTFLTKDNSKKIVKRLSRAKAVKILGQVQEDQFSGETIIMANSIIEAEPIKKQERKDNAEEKRVELHMHTKMSKMDAITSAEDLIKRAIKWGMKSIAITDHGVVQAFPEAYHLVGDNNPDFKVIYGVEAYLAPDNTKSIYNGKGQDIDTTYCVLDLETTGFSATNDRITEVGIMKVKNKQVIDKFSCFVNPERHIPERVTAVTNINDDMVKDAETIETIFPKILKFLGDEKETVIVAHNANFDLGFLKQNAKRLGYNFEYSYLDTLSLSKDLFPDYKKYKLGKIAENLGIKVEVAHRALDDVNTTVKVFNVMIDMLKEKGAKKIEDIDLLAADEETKKEEYKKLKTYHTIILAKNYVGLKNLYKLISYSHVDYFYRNPRILKSLLEKYSEGLIIGSACETGELYQAIEQGKTDEEIEEIAQFYDYLEIQPIGNNEFLIRNGNVRDEEDLRDINRKIVAIGEKLNKPVVATCDVHFMDPQDEIYRRILEAGQKYDDADNQAPLYLRTTEEMLEEFEYLGKEKAYEVVVKNTNKIADMCEKISPISPEKCPPHIPGCEEDIKNITYEKAHELYGEQLPQIVEERLEKELNSIINNGYSVMYIIAQKLVWKSNEDGYIVGSRGSVGSSLVAFMTGITEVNSLPAHYRCPNCKYSDFTDYGIPNGFDLPDKECPNCGEKLFKDGMDIPFETFLGFKGDKEPDIDLNFSGEYQAKAHKYTEVIFGKGTTFKAGTVGTVAKKTAYGYVRGYYEDRGIPVNSAEIERLSEGCVGIKRTSGQHPGGIIVVPKGREIYEFTPVQHPADDSSSDIITTHFDYHSIDANLLKLDILGHDDPTVIRMLQDLTGIKPQEIPLDDKKVLSIFQSTEALGVTPEQINSTVGTYGIPEYGTKFARGLLVDANPQSFDDLVKISGLSHGTDVWVGNAKELIESGVTTLKDAICCRDDIMIYLIKKGLPEDKAFKIMESVRKGKVAKGKEGNWTEYTELMKENNVPEWYIKSCEKIKYMFPKAHAAAYVTNAVRIAWFKVHMPIAYYAAYFSIRAKSFDAQYMIFGKEKVKNKMKEIEIKNQKKEATQAEIAMYEDLEIVLEMYERGIEFLPIDLYKSDASKFKIEDGKLRPPFNTIAGFGTVAAEGIVEARKNGKFMSIDELKIRAKIGNSGEELLKQFGCLNGMNQSNQVSLFE